VCWTLYIGPVEIRGKKNKKKYISFRPAPDAVYTISIRRHQHQQGIMFF